MKNRELRLMLAGLFLCAAMPVLAQEKSADEKKLDSAAVELDKDAGQPEGGKVVAEKMKTEFKVDDARVQGLRDQKLGYGEISIALGLAQELPGGITDANVERVMAMRQGPPVTGWGNVAKQLGLKLGPVTAKAKKISAEARKKIKAEKSKMEKRAKERGGKGGKMDKPARPEKPEKAGGHEKGGRP